MSLDPIPSSLKNCLNYPETPWRISLDLYTKVKAAKTSTAYQKYEILSSNPEHEFIMRYFQDSPPVNRHIKAAYVIHNPSATNQFEALIPSLEQEARSVIFAPKWDQEDNLPLRQATLARWQQAAGQFSPISIPTKDGKKETFPLTQVLPLWHGSRQATCDSICNTGFVFFGKHHYFKDEAQGASAAKSTDLGFFGSGIYFTNSARYAADIYSDGNLLLTWVSMRPPYPVIGDKPLPSKPTDMGKLEGLGAYQNYNAHYAPVVPLNTHDPHCDIYYPCPEGVKPVLDEYVVFHKTQTLPRFWIELAIDLPMSPSTPQLQQPHSSDKVALLPQSNPLTAFGALKWEQYFGLKVVEPPLPPDIDAILAGPCPIFLGKTVAETHFLILVPEGMTLEYLETLTENPKQGNKMGFRGKSIAWEQHNRTPTGKTHWVLMTNDVIPDSRNKSWNDQQVLAATFNGQGYELLSGIDVATCLLTEYVETGRRFYSDNPYTYTRCIEQIKLDSSELPLAIGGFASLGVNVLYHSHDKEINGVGICRKFY